MGGTVLGAGSNSQPKGHNWCPREAYIVRGEWVSYPGSTGREQALLLLLGGGGLPCLPRLTTLK